MKKYIMKEIKAYKCGHCEKIYQNMSSCKSHEYRCYFNPRTRSCASCAFFKLERREYKSGHLVQYQACLVNIPIGKTRLQTQCDKYLNVNYKEDNEIMDIVNEGYDFFTPLIDTVEKMKMK